MVSAANAGAHGGHDSYIIRNCGDMPCCVFGIYQSHRHREENHDPGAWGDFVLRNSDDQPPWGQPLQTPLGSPVQCSDRPDADGLYTWQCSADRVGQGVPHRGDRVLGTWPYGQSYR